MFGDKFVKELMVRSSENATDRRRFLQGAGAAGLGTLGAVALGGAMPAGAATKKDAAKNDQAEPDGAISDGAILNFALNLEYLEAEFYHYAAFGQGLPDGMTGGKGGRGHTVGGRKVPFKSKVVRMLADEIAGDERKHVRFLRQALGSARVGQPNINIKSSFTAAARAAGLIGAHQHFDPYANEDDFLLGAFIFEDVGVTAYKGAAPLISNPGYLEAAAGILAVEAYHAAAIRTLLFERGLGYKADHISMARDSLDGQKNRDEGVIYGGKFRVAPNNPNGIAFSRSAAMVLNVVYLTPHKARRGGFFPSGVNGEINTSGSH